MIETADILVIGGGIAGISAAARMAPDARVTLLEQEETIGYHSTGRSAAVFVRNYGNDILRALNKASEPELEEPVGISDTSLLSSRGVLMIASKDEIPAVEAYLARAEGVEELSPQEAVQQIPILRQDRIERAVFERGARDIDVDRLLQGFAKLIRAHGGRLVNHAEAVRINRLDGKWLVETPAGKFEAPVLVNAAGAWADVVAKRAGVDRVGLQPMRRSFAVLSAPAGYDVDAWPLCVSASETWYFKPAAGKLMVSPADEDPVEPHDAWPDDMVLAEGLDRFEKATNMTVTRVERSWAGLRNFVADRTPVVGFASGAEGFFWLAGQGGYGVQTSPALANLAADLVLDRPPRLSLEVVAALDPSRAGLINIMETTK